MGLAPCLTTQTGVTCVTVGKGTPSGLQEMPRRETLDAIIDIHCFIGVCDLPGFFFSIIISFTYKVFLD